MHTVLVFMSSQWRIQDFPYGEGALTPKGQAPPYYLGQFFWNLHENEIKFGSANGLDAMFLSVGLLAEIPVRNATHPLMMSFYLQCESYLHDWFARFRGCTHIPTLLCGYYFIKLRGLISVTNRFPVVSVLNKFMKMYSNSISIVHRNFRRKEPIYLFIQALLCQEQRLSLVFRGIIIFALLTKAASQGLGGLGLLPWPARGVEIHLHTSHSILLLPVSYLRRRKERPFQSMTGRWTCILSSIRAW